MTINFAHNTKTYVWDMADLDDPVLVHTHVGPTAAIDHNQFIVGNRSYQANYRAGLRILDIANPLARSKAPTSVISTANNNANFSGACRASTRSLTVAPSSLAALARGCSFSLQPRPLCTWRDPHCSCQVDALDITQAADSWNCGLGDACYRVSSP